MANDLSSVAAGEIRRFSPADTNAVLITPHPGWLSVVVSMDGTAGKVASSGSGASDGGTMPAHHKPIVDGASYTVTLVEDHRQTGQARPFYVSCDNAAGFYVIQGVGF